MRAEYIKKIGCITAVQGFKACGFHAGFKKRRKDFAVICCPTGATWAGVFTRNAVKAAPVKYDIERLADKNPIRAIVINSGSANACTGEQGMKDARATAVLTANTLGCEANEVLVSSTGVIGMPINMNTMEKAIKKTLLALNDDAGDEAAEAILTTDTFVKKNSFEFFIGDKKVRIGGIAKGSGMIHPNMGTMLAYITTDASIAQDVLQRMLAEVTDKTFNCITVDGDTSTNDTLIIMANGMAGNPLIENEESEGYEQFYNALEEMCRYLAQQIARDGEGATKFIEVIVSNAASTEDAVKIGKSVASSNLVKTAMFGKDANWGRVICAIGYSGAKTVLEENIDIVFSSEAGDIIVCQQGTDVPFDEKLAKKILDKKDITILINMNCGDKSAKVWTCDFSYDYVKINADYRS